MVADGGDWCLLTIFSFLKVGVTDSHVGKYFWVCLIELYTDAGFFGTALA